MRASLPLLPLDYQPLVFWIWGRQYHTIVGSKTTLSFSRQNLKLSGCCLPTSAVTDRSVCRGIEASMNLPREKRKFTHEENNLP